MNADTLRLLAEADAERSPNCLDLGCGDGTACFWMADRGARVLGVDHALPLPPGLPTSITGVGPGSVVLINADALEFDPGETFEVITTLGLLHSLGSLRSVTRVLERLATLCAPGGRVLMSWLLDASPLTARHARAFFPATDRVEGMLAGLGFDMNRRWIATIEHAHPDGWIHTHRAVYASWRRQP